MRVAQTGAVFSGVPSPSGRGDGFGRVLAFPLGGRDGVGAGGRQKPAEKGRWRDGGTPGWCQAYRHGLRVERGVGGWVLLHGGVQVFAHRDPRPVHVEAMAWEDALDEPGEG